MRIGAQRLELRFEPLDLGRARTAQRHAPAHADAHRAQHGEIGRRAVAGVAGPPELLRLGVLERGFDQIGKFEILEQDVEEFGLGQGERERVLAAARAGALASLTAAARLALRLVDDIAGDEVLVAGQDELALAAVARKMELRLVDAVRRNRHRAALADVCDGPLGHRLVDRTLDLGPDATKETLTVAQALVTRIETAVDELGHSDSSL